MKRPIVYILISIAILLIGFAGYEFNRKLGAINRKVISLNQRVDSLNQMIDSTSQKVDSINQRIDSIAREVNAVTLKTASNVNTDNKLKGRHSKIPSQPDNFTDRKMQSFLIQLENNDFESVTLDKKIKFVNWNFQPQREVPSTIKLGKGYKSRVSLSFSTKRDTYDEKYDEVWTIVDIPSSIRSEQMNISVSAWVWSDTPASTYFEIEPTIDEADSTTVSVSAFHPGNSRWEYLTVVYPYSKVINKLKIKLLNKEGIAKFDNVQPVVIYDDRFTDIADNLTGFRERITYKKNNRIRIAVVGNSTINGIGAARNATFSYVLQSKLESLFPGKFEVINYGICSWRLQAQIVSLASKFQYSSVDHKTLLTFLPSNSNEVTLENIQPDIILLGSFWNDIRYHEYMLYPTAILEKDGIPYTEIAFKSLLNYIDAPDDINYKIAEFIYSSTMQEGEQLRAKLPPTVDEMIKSNYHEKVISSATSYYTFLMKEFAERASRWSKVWTFTFPFKGGSDYKRYIKAVPQFMTIENNPEYEYHSLKITREIEDNVIEKVSMGYDLPFVHLNAIFKRDHNSLHPVVYANLGYFSDILHFQYRGNEYLADRFFMVLKEEFYKLAGSKKYLQEEGLDN